MQNAPRLIDANKLDLSKIYTYFGGVVLIEDVQKWIEEAPTIEAEPVRHERWERKRNYFRCTSCGTAYKSVYCGPNIAKFKRCPNCGAKMDEGESDA